MTQINYLILIICAEKEEESEEKKNYYRTEHFQGSMMRSFAFPDNVDCDKINAKMKGGRLKVILPKTAEGGQKAKEIKIE